MVQLSVLDLAYIGEGFTPADALANALDLAQHAEAAGFARFWLAEHHNLAGIASAATAVCICHVAGGTKTIRVGAGGIMLPNHSPMVIAEQFGTLATLFPDRIDLGLGRAPGTDQRTLQALRRGPSARNISRRRGRAASPSRPAAGEPGDPRDSRRGYQRTTVDFGLQPVRCPARRHAWPTLRLRLALRAAGADASGVDLPRAILAVGSSSPNPM